MVRKKLISVALAAVFATTLATPAFADTDADLAAAQAAQDQAESAYDASESQIASMQSEQSDLQSYLTDLNSQLDSLSQSLSDLDTKISDKSSEIEITKGSPASSTTMRTEMRALSWPSSSRRTWIHF